MSLSREEEKRGQNNKIRKEVGRKREKEKESLPYKIVKRVKRTKDEIKYCMYASGNIW